MFSYICYKITYRFYVYRMYSKQKGSHKASYVTKKYSAHSAKERNKIIIGISNWNDNIDVDNNGIHGN